MCGIAGIITKKPDIPIQKMLDVIAHRGPDDEGAYRVTHGDYSVTLGHRRLSIIDLSAAGHQPMSRSKSQLWITYNGELYNFPELQKELESLGHTFASKTDTEVILAAYEQWGDDALKKFNGMFAFALWDNRRKRLLMARDHTGQKPLYYAKLPDGGIVFASEIKSILASGLITPRVHLPALGSYLASLRVHAPETMFEGIYKVKASHAIVWHDGESVESSYWDILNIPRFAGSFTDAQTAFHTLFDQAIDRHLIADVPVGAFLSGGLDSSMIVARATRMGSNRVLTTFTTGFSDTDARSEQNKNELEYARSMAAHLGVAIRYNEIILNPDVTSILPKIMWHLDEPICDPAEINSYLICEQARRNGITVLLSGNGADELFGGYNHHLLAWMLSEFDRFHIPRFVTSAAIGLAAAMPINSPHIRYLRRKGKFLAGSSVDRIIGLSSWLLRDEVVKLLPSAVEDVYASKRTYLTEGLSHFDPLGSLLYADLKTFLADHINTYTDRMGMAWSCEMRAPFLDRELIEFAFSLPSSYKIHKGTTKYLLKRVALAYLPEHIVMQRKTGFAAPIRAWQSQIQTLSHELLGNDSPALQYFDGTAVRAAIADHAAGDTEASYKLWSLITFSLWHKIWIEGKNV